MDEKYVMDFSLFRVAKQLRLLGCDVACDRSILHSQVLAIAKGENRIIVTASRKLIPHLEACQRNDLRENDGNSQYFVGEFSPKTRPQNCLGRIKEDRGALARPSVKTATATRDATILQDTKRILQRSAEKEEQLLEHEEGEKATDQETKLSERRRILKGYNSEGESEYEEEDETTGPVECKPKQAPKKEGKHKRLKGYNSEGESEYEEEDASEDDGSNGSHSGGNLLSVGSHSGDEDDWSEEEEGDHAEAAVLKQETLDAMGQENDELSTASTEVDPPIRYVMVNPFDPFRLQVENIIGHMGILWDSMKVFSRCVQCNGVIRRVDHKEDVADEVHETVYKLYTNFYRCVGCKGVYWGMDEGVLVNYKTLRTVEHAKAMCLRAHRSAEERTLGAEKQVISERKQTHPEKTVSVVPSGANVLPQCHKQWGSAPLAGVQSMEGLKVHLFAYPRNIKCTILSYLSTDDHTVLLVAYPMFSVLIGVVQRGDSWSFKPDKKRRNRFKEGNPVPQGSHSSTRYQ